MRAFARVGVERRCHLKRVILTIGPQCAGKSTLCEKCLLVNPEIILVSRDKILMELFGSVWLDPYTGGHFYGMKVMWERVKKHLEQEDVTLILDTWNGYLHERKAIIEKLRSMNVERIDAWYFITPKNTCLEWFLQRESSSPKEGRKFPDAMSKMRKDSCIRDYEFYHSHQIGDELFDSVKRINSLQPPSFDELLALQGQSR
ncbi:MAG: AAA family ATPase [Patescibacteria group bacterium]|nr:AAA family ATPase [bacterium]MDZ4240866.1 AAA family ATPase [Patescibacteria group bacterium]